MNKLYGLMMTLCCFSAAEMQAQEKTMETDRPGETLTVALVTKAYFQLETGFRKEQQNHRDFSLLHPTMLVRYGLSDRVELRAEIGAESEKLYSENVFHYGLQPVELGLKVKAADQKGLRPATTLYLQAGIPNWASADHQKDHLFPKVRLLFENKLTEKLMIAYNGGAEWQGDDKGPRYIYTIEPEFSLTDKWDVFVETFAYLQSGQAAQHYLDGGLAFRPYRNLRLDIWAGKGLSKEASDYFVSAGVSFRVK